jgi:hypothetical protein
VKLCSRILHFVKDKGEIHCPYAAGELISIPFLKTTSRITNNCADL